MNTTPTIFNPLFEGICFSSTPLYLINRLTPVIFAAALLVAALISPTPLPNPLQKFLKRINDSPNKAIINPNTKVNDCNKFINDVNTSNYLKLVLFSELFAQLRGKEKLTPISFNSDLAIRKSSSLSNIISIF